MNDDAPSLDESANHDAARLLPVVYSELRRLAAAKLASERPGHTLDATALVHEAFLRLGGEQSFASKSDFLRASAVTMQRILVDHARAKLAEKRGGGQGRMDLDPSHLFESAPGCDVLAIHEVLEQFKLVDPKGAELVMLRYFAGLTLPEAAEVLGISTSTADRWWLYAKSWLYQKLQNA